MNRGWWPAPAKLNLFLHVVGRRADGYHRLQTVFQFLDYGDRLRVEGRADGDLVAGHSLPGIAPDDDLVLGAARALKAHTGTVQGATLTLDKRLPAGGGLGGGSSDAATTLIALNQIWETGCSEDELAAIGLGLGADVPVFVRGRAAWAEGVGEELTPVVLPEPWYLVVHPGVSVATADVFRDPDLNRAMEAITIADFLDGAGENGLQPVVVAREPQVAAALAWLDRHAPARMTGSGACLFAPFADAAAAETVRALLPREWNGFVARGCNRSPLFAAESSENA